MEVINPENFEENKNEIVNEIKEDVTQPVNIQQEDIQVNSLINESNSNINEITIEGSIVEKNENDNIQIIDSNKKIEVVLDNELENIKNQVSKIEKDDDDDNEVENINFIKLIELILESNDLESKYENKLNPSIIKIAKNIIEKFPDLILVLKMTIYFRFENDELNIDDIAHVYKELFEILYKFNIKNTHQETGTLLKFLIEIIINDNEELREVEKIKKEINKLIDFNIIIATNIKKNKFFGCCFM